MPLIAISGSQGLGKSVFINHLHAHRNMNIIERKTSRSVLSDWGVTLSEVNNDRPLTLKFQDEILKRKAEDERVGAESDDLYVTERSFADLFTYAVVAVGKDNECSDWLDEYYEKCIEAQRSLMGVLYLTRAGRIDNTIVHDGVRGINRHYGIMVDETMTYFTKEMADLTEVGLQFCDASDLVDRTIAFDCIMFK